MIFALELVEISAPGFTRSFCGCIATEGSVYTMIVVILSECFQFSLQVAGIPEECKVKVFPANGPNHSLYKGM
jgi:hypothetical protein